jgi:hypothetical protein
MNLKTQNQMKGAVLRHNLTTLRGRLPVFRHKPIAAQCKDDYCQAGLVWAYRTVAFRTALLEIAERGGSVCLPNNF